MQIHMIFKIVFRLERFVAILTHGRLAVMIDFMMLQSRLRGKDLSATRTLKAPLVRREMRYHMTLQVMLAYK